MLFHSQLAQKILNGIYCTTSIMLDTVLLTEFSPKNSLNQNCFVVKKKQKF